VDPKDSPSKGFNDVGINFPGRVVPGVTIQSTPACGSFTPGPDPFTGGTHQTLGPLQSQPTFQIVGMVGGATNGGMPATTKVQVATPMAPTLIDSWASVLE
jgi:hypothetical protein